MTITNQQRELERTRFWQGQALLSRDFNDLLDIEAHRRWWHNRALHDAYGVANGFDVINKKQEKVVWVGTGMTATNFKQLNCTTGCCPSLAYDCYGGELILQHSRVIAWPASTHGWWTLLARYRPNEDFFPAAFGSSSTVPNAKENPSFAWSSIPKIPKAIHQESDMLTMGDLDIDITDGVPLAVGRFNKSGELVLQSFHKPPVRPLWRSYIVRDLTVKGKTNWEPWQAIDGHGMSSGIEVTVDTSAFGFHKTPCYFANTLGPKWAPMAKQELNCSTELLSLVKNQFSDKFTFSLWAKSLTRGKARCVDELVKFARRNLCVCWHAVESMPSRECVQDLGETK